MCGLYLNVRHFSLLDLWCQVQKMSLWFYVLEEEIWWVDLLNRMEKIQLKRSTTRAKVLGTVVSIAGAFVVTLYKGPKILVPTTATPNLLRQPLSSSQSNWMLGGLFLTTEYFLVPMWYIVQVWYSYFTPTQFLQQANYATYVSYLQFSFICIFSLYFVTPDSLCGQVFFFTQT